MHAKVDFLYHNLETVIVAILTFFLAISFATVFTIVPGILASIYWVVKLLEIYKQKKKK